MGAGDALNLRPEPGFHVATNDARVRHSDAIAVPLGVAARKNQSVDTKSTFHLPEVRGTDSERAAVIDHPRWVPSRIARTGEARTCATCSGQSNCDHPGGCDDRMRMDVHKGTVKPRRVVLDLGDGITVAVEDVA